nr:MAG TPA: hypothetical protein [Caudoviricetes sp.]
MIKDLYLSSTTTSPFGSSIYASYKVVVSYLNSTAPFFLSLE